VQEQASLRRVRVLVEVINTTCVESAAAADYTEFDFPDGVDVVSGDIMASEDVIEGMAVVSACYSKIGLLIDNVLLNTNFPILGAPSM